MHAGLESVDELKVALEAGWQFSDCEEWKALTVLGRNRLKSWFQQVPCALYQRIATLPNHLSVLIGLGDIICIHVPQLTLVFRLTRVLCVLVSTARL